MVVVTESAGALILMLSVALLVACAGVWESVKVTVNVVVPVNVPVGVPEMTPVEAFKLNPAGKLPVVTAQV